MNKQLLLKVYKSKQETNYKSRIIDRVCTIAKLISFRLADFVNIALEEGTYFRDKEWKQRNKDKLLVEHK